LLQRFEDHPALRIFRELVSVPSPSGREELIRAIIQEKIVHLGFTFESDLAGNILVRLAGKEADAPLCVLAAHMDEIGVVVTRIADDGSLCIDRSGGLHPWKMGERPVEILGDFQAITGVTSMGSAHTHGTEDKTIKWEDVRVVTGLTPEQLGQAGVRPGSVGVPLRTTRGPVLFGDPNNPMAAAWTFDDRMGVVALLRLLDEIKRQNIQPYHPTIIAFTVQEEIGGQGAKVLANREKPGIFIAIDGCPIPPGSPLKLDGRPGIWSHDQLGPYDQQLVKFFLSCARDAGTELQPAAYDRAASDASMVYASGLTERIAVVGHVRENSHGYEVVRLSVFDNLLKVLVQFLKTWKNE
jgi:putative aminopeptidase FrvX